MLESKTIQMGSQHHATEENNKTVWGWGGGDDSYSISHRVSLPVSTGNDNSIAK